jgi:uncharacterized protein with gpF-like domain
MVLFNRSEFFAKATTLSIEEDRLRRLLSMIEGDLRRQFDDFVERSTSPEMMAEVSERLEHNDVDGALNLIEPHIRTLGTSIPRLFTDAAFAETTALADQVRASVAVSFDPTYPAAADLMRRNQLQFVQGLTEQQTVATREALSSALETGRGFEATARAFRQSIGVAPDQVQAVANYERLLRANSSMALDRALRDRRFDPALENAIEEGEPLSEEKIARMVGRYQERMLAFRARTIARTESISILSQAQEASMAQNITSGAVMAEEVEQVWNATIDNRTRETHLGMNGQVRPWGEPFQSPSGAFLRYPGDPNAPASEVANCRCRRSFKIKLSSERMLAA